MQIERLLINVINFSQSQSNCDVFIVLICISFLENEYVKLIELCFFDIEKNDIFNKIYYYMFCSKSDCCFIILNEKFDYVWLNLKDLFFCRIIRLWYFVFVEG